LGDFCASEAVFAGFRRFFVKASDSNIQAYQPVAPRDGFVLTKFRFRAALLFHMDPYTGEA
jgi:hypothetical protein